MSKKYENLLVGLATMLLVPFFILNIGAGIIGGIWLLMSGGLSLVIYGIILSVIMPFVYSLIFIPQMLLATLLVKVLEKGNRFITAIIGFLLSIYTNATLVIWTLVVFELLVKNQSFSVVPLLLWGYSTVMAPLGYMAKGESKDNVGTSVGILLSQLSYLVLTFIFLMGGSSSTQSTALGVLVVGFSALTISVMLKGMASVKAINRKSRILFVEDDTTLLKIFGDKFTEAGLQVDLVDNGRDGVIKIMENYYDVILTGMMLPHLNGIEMLEEVKKQKLKHGPIIVLSGLTEKQEVERAKSLGAKEYLSKAMTTPDDVIEVVKKYI